MGLRGHEHQGEDARRIGVVPSGTTDTYVALLVRSKGYYTRFNHGQHSKARVLTFDVECLTVESGHRLPDDRSSSITFIMGLDGRAVD